MTLLAQGGQDLSDWTAEKLASIITDGVGRLIEDNQALDLFGVAEEVSLAQAQIKLLKSLGFQVVRGQITRL